MYGALALARVNTLEEEVRRLSKKIKDLEEALKSFKCSCEMKY